MAGFKSIGILVMLIATILMMIAPSAMACLQKGERCKKDGTLGDCCKGYYCSQYSGHGSGKCKVSHQLPF